MGTSIIGTGHVGSALAADIAPSVRPAPLAEQTPDELAQLAVEDGVSIFMLASDDPDVIERFAAETTPAVREHVTRVRA